MRKNNRKGFTLGELLLVLAIIGVMVAIAIPVYSNATEGAKVKVDDANAKAIESMALVQAMVDDITKETVYYGVLIDNNTNVADINDSRNSFNLVVETDNQNWNNEKPKDGYNQAKVNDKSGGDPKKAGTSVYKVTVEAPVNGNYSYEGTWTTKPA